MVFILYFISLSNSILELLIANIFTIIINKANAKYVIIIQFIQKLFAPNSETPKNVQSRNGYKLLSKYSPIKNINKSNIKVTPIFIIFLIFSLVFIFCTNNIYANIPLPTYTPTFCLIKKMINVKIPNIYGLLFFFIKRMVVINIGIYTSLL